MFNFAPPSVMVKKYSQFRAMWAITKASLTATFRSPQSVFFSLFFPLVLIVIFSSLGGGGEAAVDVAFDRGNDSSNLIFKELSHHPLLRVKKGTDAEMDDLLKKGRITAIIHIDSASKDKNAVYNIHLKTSDASKKDLGLLQSVIRDYIHLSEKRLFAGRPSLAVISETTIPGRKYKMIDFLLPGMIGLALIGSAIFGVAFSFFSFRESLVLKRLYSTPVSRTFILLGEGISRVIFQMTTVVFLIAFGYWFYGFTLANGIVTVLNMLIISFIGLLVFMGFGFFISGLAKNQNVIPIYSNIFMFPQYFLSGTFFPKTALPEGVQAVINFLPLTAVNDAMRNIAFEGAGLFSCWPQLAVLVGWGIAVYAAAVKFFKWE